MIKRALSTAVLLASASFAAPTAPPTGSSVTVTQVPNIAFGQALLSDPPASAVKAVTASSAQVAPVPAIATSASKAAEWSSARLPSSSRGEKPTSVQTAEPAPPAGTSDEGEGSHWWTEKTVSDLLMLVFTGLLALFTYLLWRSTKALWEETKSAGATAKTAAEAATASADAAGKSATATLLSVEASIAAQQPRWLVKAMHLHSQSDYPKPSTSRTVVVSLMNHGSSAAEVLRTEMRYRLVVTPHGASQPASDLNHAAPMDFIKTDRDFGHITNGGEAFQFMQPTGFDESALAGLEAGIMRYFIVGKLQYRDYLDRTWEHSFVGVLDPKRMNLRNPPNTGQAATSPFVQPLPGPDTDPFTYTRRIDPKA